MFSLLQQRKSYIKRADEGRKGRDLLPASLLDRLNESSLCKPWDKSLLLTPPQPLTSVLGFLSFSPCLFQESGSFLDWKLQKMPLPRLKKLPRNWGTKSPLSLGSPTPAWGLLAGNWEQLSVCYLKGTHFIRIFSQGPFWGASSRCRFLGWEERICPQDPHRFLCQLLREELHRV